jgi:uncharacterized protein (TIGR02646 family)
MPSSLRRGIAATRRDCAAFDADPDTYKSGARKFKIAKGIYGTDVVKRQLKIDQHGKCIFCEAIFDANSAGDVEHFRPKTAVTVGTVRTYPGYYWLGYDWSNLSYACTDCNAYRKGDRFPLAEEDARARSHHEDIAIEAPLLLNPYGDDDPREHIFFRGEAPIGCSPEGETTIEVLALGRTALARERLRHLHELSDMRKSAMLLEIDGSDAAVAHAARLRAKLAAAVHPRARFSAAAADHLEALEAGHDYLPPEDPDAV